MKIFTVTPHFSDSVGRLFSKVGDTDILPTGYKTMKNFDADLIVFTGGEDIFPTYYGEEPRGYNSAKRDIWEFKVLNDILTGKLKTKKVLGICRGMQLLNVGFRGTLHYDILERYGIYHSSIHPIKHIQRNPFEFLTTVNSLHHQAIKKYGMYGRNVVNILAVEPATGLPEIIELGNKYLGFQFHPEFFQDDNKDKWKVAETIESWVTGRINLLRSSVYGVSDEYYESESTRGTTQVLSRFSEFRNQLSRISEGFTQTPSPVELHEDDEIIFYRGEITYG